jgi:hypothetical protein
MQPTYNTLFPYTLLYLLLVATIYSYNPFLQFMCNLIVLTAVFWLNFKLQQQQVVTDEKTARNTETVVYNGGTERRGDIIPRDEVAGGWLLRKPRDSRNRLVRIPRSRMNTTAESRELTFSFSWPHDDVNRCSISMAKAGFYRAENLSKDAVRCRYCFIIIDTWLPTDTALGEHKKHSIKCPFLRIFPEGCELKDEWEIMESAAPYLVVNSSGTFGLGKLYVCYCCSCRKDPPCVYTNSSRCIKCQYECDNKCSSSDDVAGSRSCC